MKNRGSNTSTPSNDFRMYVPYDEYIYRKISDLCLDFVNTYKELESDDGLTVTKLENIFEALLNNLIQFIPSYILTVDFLTKNYIFVN